MNERLRIGDAEREAAAHELGEHFAMGRITADEHGERLEQVWAARTAADLAPAFRDLPRQRAAQPPPRPVAPAVRRGWRPEWPRIPFPFKLLVALVAIWWGFHHPRWSCTSWSCAASSAVGIAGTTAPGVLVATRPAGTDVLLTWRFRHALPRSPAVARRASAQTPIARFSQTSTTSIPTFS